MLAIGTALAGPLLYLLGEESGGFHLFGPSSIGKTTAAHVARSVWGMPLGSWRTTGNGAEGLARGACDTLLTLDEIGQAPPAVLEELAYLLGNGRGKARMRRDATARPTETWRLLFLSTGEVGLATKLAEGGRRPMAGQSVRMVELPADAGQGLGIFDTLNGWASGAALADLLRLAADRHCGHAGRAFVERLAADADGARQWAGHVRDDLLARLVPAGADGQVRRVAGRFALAAVAGELATHWAILPWAPGEAAVAIERCFADWLRQRGGTEPAEITAALRQVRLFLEQHGLSRFEAAWERVPVVAGEPIGTGGLHRTINRAGFRKREGGGWQYYILKEVWAAEVCKGFDPALVARAMSAHGWLSRDGKNLTRKERIPGEGSMRVYVICPGFSGAEPEAANDDGRSVAA
jgi:uncharacterized protein (DUF927 family)